MPTLKQAAITRGPTGYHNLAHTPTPPSLKNKTMKELSSEEEEEEERDDDDELQGLLNKKKKDATKARERERERERLLMMRSFRLAINATNKHNSIRSESRRWQEIQSATSAIPLLSPVLGPVAQNFSPILAQLTASPTLRLEAEIAMQQLKQFESVSPPIVKQVLPLIEQLPPLYVDLANGKDQFVPTPDETDRLLKCLLCSDKNYGIGQNLLIKFKDDQIDETPRLAQALSSNSAVSGFLDMSVRVLPGFHARPLLQVFPVVPPNMARTINRGSELFSTMAAGTPFAEIAKGLGSNPTAQRLREEVIENIESLIDEIASWMTASA
ncbi:unnamed protein product [Sphagnum compactum]